ncbi:MAG: beta-galactosidase [Lentisphaeria bacterium]|nr:beta-galactosidase [Lentisphaeria bacterium]
MYAYPLYPNRSVRSLDGIWEFAFLGTDAPKLEELAPQGIAFHELMAVPGCFDAAPKYAGVRGVGAYRRTVEAPANAKLRLRIGALGLRGRIFWDGRAVALNELPYSQQTYEIEAGGAGAHELIILIDNRLNPVDTPLFHHFYDFYGYGGIYRSVELETLPEGVRFERARVETPDLSGRLLVSGRLTGGPAELSAGFDGAEPETVNARFDGENFSFEAQLPSPAPWSPESPNLHTVTLKAGNDVIVERFGVRTIGCRGGELLLNGEPVRLAGYNRHDAHPQFGPAMTDELWIEDLQILRDLGCNFIRGCHYPQSQRFLDLCDQLGFLVWEESLGWGDDVNVQADPKFRRLQVEQTVNMVECSINHPSIILWGFMNEAGDDKEVGASLLRELAGAVRATDRTRPVTNASMHIRESLVLDAFDVISFNIYPGWYEHGNTADPRPLERIPVVLDEILGRLDTEELRGKPVIISEIGAGAIYGWRDRVRGIWSEEYQADYLAVVCDYFRKNKRVNGLALWQFTDGRTYAAGNVLGRPRAFNNKGTLDEYRRPKLAYDVVKKQFERLES